MHIVTLGGVLDSAAEGLSGDTHTATHTIEDTRSLMKDIGATDILLTSIWPAGIWNGSRVPLDPSVEPETIPSSQELASLCTALKPLYVLSPSSDNYFFERTPFTSKSPTNSHRLSRVTRFLSLAPFNNVAKAKSLYAFQLPASQLSIEATTPCPFPCSGFVQNKRGCPDGDNIRFSNHGDYWRPENRRGPKRHRRGPPGPQECFFCLGNLTIADHMLVSVGKATYLATAKGPLPNSSTFAAHGLKTPAHILIVPLEHGNSVVTMKDDWRMVLEEMTRFRKALQSMIGYQSKQRLGSVTWEISLSKSVHVHWQFLPVNASKILAGLVEAAFKAEAKQSKIMCPLVEAEPHLADAANPFGVPRDFFRIWLRADLDEDDNGEQGGKIVAKTLVMDLTNDQERRFDFQYPRRVMCKLMEMPERYSWKACEQSKEEEAKDVEDFKEMFSQWDFTLRDDYF